MCICNKQDTYTYFKNTKLLTSNILMEKLKDEMKNKFLGEKL
jgi:flavin reductase (DIM6/NTAB) family NADH-FMN oxidoreductase RutF